MRQAKEILYEEFVKTFPHVTKEMFEKSITKDGLIEGALRAMVNYADERLVAASNIVLNATKENPDDTKEVLCKKIRHKFIEDINLD